MNRRRLQGVLIRLACLAVGLILLWPMIPWEAGPRVVVETSPLVAVCASIINRSIGLTAGVGLIFGILSILKKRWFCRFICPTGLLLDGISHVGLKKLSWWSRCPPIGQYAAALTLAGTLIGYPVLLWMDPMALFSSPFAIPAAGELLSGIMAGTLLGILMLITLLLGGIWCGRLCPLGGFLGLISKLALVRREPGEDCKGCTICTSVCPTGTIDPNQNYQSDPSECTLCLDCLESCPRSSTGRHIS